MKLFKDVQSLQEAYTNILKEAPTPKPAPATPTPTPAKVTPGKTAQQGAAIVKDLNQNPPTLPIDDPDLDDIQAMDDPAIRPYLETDLPEMDYKTFYMMVNVSYDTKEPLLIYGEPGIGKSAIIKNIGHAIANQKGKQFFEWNRSNPNQKMEFIKNPSQYFVLVDVRTKRLEPSDFTGIPDLTSPEDFLRYKKSDWIKFVTTPEADGILFFDEINQGRQDVRQSLYSVINAEERQIGDDQLGTEIGVMAAGNLTDRDDELEEALTSRFTAGVLVADPQEWLKWAEHAGIDKRIIAFVKANPEENFIYKPKASSGAPSPRSFKALTKILKKLYTTYYAQEQAGKANEVGLYKLINTYASAKCGWTWGAKFTEFVQHIRSFDIKLLLKDPTKYVDKSNINKLNALIAFFIDKIRVVTNDVAGGKEPTPEDLDILAGLATLSNNLHPEWVTILWSNLKSDLPIKQFAGTMEFLQKWNYDAKIKEQFLKKTLPTVGKIMKGED
jgi:MoxR-like ATPase